MIKNFLNFIPVNEDYEFSELHDLSDHEIKNLKKIVFDEMGKIQEHILKRIHDTKKEVAYDEDIFDFDEIMQHLRHKIGKSEVSDLNLSAFFGKIRQILELKRKDTSKCIRREFADYEKSFDFRTRKNPAKEDPHFDEYEQEHSKVHRRTYEIEKHQLDIELSKLQRWVETNKKRVCIVFEGRDSAGKGSAIKRFIERMNPRVFRVVALGVPTEEDKNNWFKRYERYLPNPGEVILFDRSWYNRAVVEPAMGYCTGDQYDDFMNKVLDWEEKLIDEGMILIKFWFSITKDKQKQRFEIRQKSPIKYWKFSPNDAAVVNKWDIITKYKNLMFKKTSSPASPWVVVNSNDKRIGRLNSIRYALSKIPYDDKNEDLMHWYPEVITIIE